MYYIPFFLLLCFIHNQIYSMLITSRIQPLKISHRLYRTSTMLCNNNFDTIDTYHENRDKKTIIRLAQKNQTLLSSYPTNKDPIYNQWFLQEIENSFKAPTLCKVYLLDNKPIGFITYTISYPWYTKYLPNAIQPHMHIHYLAIDDEYKKNGYGKQLLEHAIEDGKKHSVTHITLRTSEEAPTSLYQFYSRNGFKIGRSSKYSLVLEWKMTFSEISYKDLIQAFFIHIKQKIKPFKE